MPLKGKIVYFVIPVLLFVIGKMIHPIFYFFVIIYFFYCIKFFYMRWLVSIMIVFTISVFLFKLPQINHISDAHGTVVAIDEESIVIKNGYEKIKVYGKFENVSIYDKISLTGEEQEISLPANDHAFHYQHYLYSLNIFHVLNLNHIVYHQKTKHIYHFLEKKVNQDSSLSGMISLFVLGSKDEQMKDFYEKLTNLSLVHLFALSGMHLTILQKWLKQFLKFFFSEKIQNILSVVIIGIYISIIPYNISFLRAYLMMLLPMLLHRYFNRLDIFSLLTIVMLFYNPYLIYNLSFLFSYIIYFFILLFENHQKMKYLLIFASFPIILCVNYRINIFSFVMSICMIPYIEFMYKMILYDLLLGNYLAFFLSLLFQGFESIVHFLSQCTFYLTFSKPTLFFILVYYYIYLKLILKVNMKRSMQKELSCLLGLVIAFYFYPLYDMQGKVVMINVGQGDCFLIKQPFASGNILIDTGGLKNRDIATDTIIPYLYSEGVKKLDAVFISHQDDDHCGALDSLMSNFKVEKVIYDFKQETIGKLTFKNLAIEQYYDDENDRSSIIYVKINHLYYLFTGDISEKVEKDLYYQYQNLKVDVLKVAHHGSSTSTSAFLLKFIHPKVALISVGKNNIYHHPHPLTIQRLNDYGIHIYRTDLTGMVSIVYYGKDNYIFQ